MRLRTACLAALLAALPMLAQAQSKAKAPAGPETRYFTSIDGLSGDADVILKEVRQGNTVTAATLDFCYDLDKFSDRKDRFVATLAVQGNTLTGTAESLGEKRPVSVKLTQRATADGFEFKGEIVVGQTRAQVSSSGNSDLSESEYEEIRAAGDSVVGAPADWTEVSPESVAVKVRVEAAGEFLKALRGQAVEISSASLALSCAELRAGSTTMVLTIDPARAADFVTSAKNLPGVVTAGWASGSLDLTRAVRFPGAPWRDGDRPNRDKIASALGTMLETSYRAKLQSSRWNDLTGKLTLTLKRPSESFPALGLIETLEFTAFVAPDRPGSGDRLILWVGLPTSAIRDESSDRKLNFAEPVMTEEGGDVRGIPEIVDKLATIFAGQRWDFDTSNWR